jgi:hypothetical protein
MSSITSNASPTEPADSACCFVSAPSARLIPGPGLRAE